MYQQLKQHTATGCKRYSSITFYAQFESVTSCTQHVLSVGFDSYFIRSAEWECRVQQGVNDTEQFVWCSYSEVLGLLTVPSGLAKWHWCKFNTAQLFCCLEMFLFTTINKNSFLLQNSSLSHSKIILVEQLVELTIFIFYHHDNENHCLII